MQYFRWNYPDHHIALSESAVGLLELAFKLIERRKTVILDDVRLSSDCQLLEDELAGILVGN